MSEGRWGRLLALSIPGLAGFYIGWVSFARLQVAVETAQVVAGIVTYPPDNPFYLYHTKIWTVLHQVLAVLLRLGVDERTLSLALSGLMGMLSLQALALMTLAIGGSVLLAVGVPFVVLFSAATDHGVIYPIWLMGTSHTYGVVGLSAAVLAAGLIGSGSLRSGPFLLGLLPAIHPSIGAWTTLAVMLALLWERRTFRLEREPISWWAIGVACTFLSLLHQWIFVMQPSLVDPAMSAPYVNAFTQLWDWHRDRVNIFQFSVYASAISGVLAILWLMFPGRHLARSTSFTLRLIVVFTAMGVGVVLFSRLPIESVPTGLLALMPSRLLNFNVFLLVPLLCGLSWSSRTAWGSAIGAFVAAGLLTSASSLFWRTGRTLDIAAPSSALGHEHIFYGAGIAFIIVWVSMLFRRDRQQGHSVRAGTARFVSAVFTIVTLAACACAAWLAFRLPAAAPLKDRTNDAFWAEIASDSDGFTAVSGPLVLIQLTTRRPVLVNTGGLDGLIYAPESAPALADLLREVYHVDLLHPPEEARGIGMMPDGFNRQVWERFTREDWQRIGQTYHVSQIVTSERYELTLPVAAQAHGLRLYRIPS